MRALSQIWPKLSGGDRRRCLAGAGAGAAPRSTSSARQWLRAQPRTRDEILDVVVQAVPTKDDGISQSELTHNFKQMRQQLYNYVIYT